MRNRLYNYVCPDGWKKEVEGKTRIRSEGERDGEGKGETRGIEWEEKRVRETNR